MDEHRDRMNELLERRLNREDRRPRKRSPKKKKVYEEPLADSADLYTGSADEGKGKKKRSIPGLIFRLILLALLVAVIWLGVSMGREYFRSTREGGKKVEITIEKGDGIKGISKKLKEKGIIKYRLPFLLKAHLTRQESGLRYGTFELDDRMSLDDILKELTSKGANKDQISLTIPEGYSVQRIAALLEQKDIMKAEEFLKALKDYEGSFAYQADLPDPRTVDYALQGYLFPDTYYLDKDVTADQLIKKMLDGFETHFPQEKREQAAQMGMTVTDVVTRASLVQQETVLPKEYPIVADVLTNRMEIKMNLQLDSTVVYALTDGLYNKEKVYYTDLKVDSPYNTYTHKGLPPGPICCPGQAALDAVLNPDDNNYLYFQTDSQAGDGSNLYFETYEEHSSAQATTGTTGTQETDTVPEAATEAPGSGSSTPAKNTEAVKNTEGGAAGTSSAQ